jgi:hypothetical protein
MLGSSPQDETLKLVSRITEDGVLDTEEVYDLAEFLNENPEAAQVWPGDVLHQALTSVFDDGTLSDEEMAALGQLVQDIEQEAAESELPTVWDDTHSQGPPPPLDVVELLVPTLDGSPRSGSDDDGTSFTVSPGDLTCTCEDWTTRRADLPERSPGRLCRHLVTEMNRIKDSLPEMNAAFSWLLGERTQRGKGTHPVEFYNLLMTDDGTCLVSFGSSKWAHLLVPIEEAAYDRFGFDFETRHWSYGRQPSGFGAVKRYVLDLQVET